MTLPSHTLEELKALTLDFADYDFPRWYKAEDNPNLYVTFGEYGERIHLTYIDETNYIIELGKVHSSGLGWDDLTQRILSGEETISDLDEDY